MSEVQTQEEKDLQELREVESKIKEVLELMTQRHTRENTDEKLQVARARRDEARGDSQSTFYRVRGSSAKAMVPTSMHTHSHLELGEVLKTRIKLGQYAADLEDSLRRLSERHVEVLERILERARY
jgi:hypothetical protein